MNKPESNPAPKPPVPRPKPYRCTYCGVRLSVYSGRRAEWEVCPNCGILNTIEMEN